ncbi:MAG: hypothetical protein GEU94_04745 [Micromonosporaceae bacterium]|nr:hypothetical protein [Micromonosporaceae bacterium]
MATLEDWTQAVRVALDLDVEVDEALVLDLAREAAHGVMRPAAPLTTYLLGLAVARGDDPRATAEKLTDLARGWQ